MNPEYLERIKACQRQIEEETRALREAMIEAGARGHFQALYEHMPWSALRFASQHEYRKRAAAILEASGALDLAAAVQALLRRHDDENPGAAFSPDGGCIECTSGVTPDRFNTGLCPHHQIERILGRLKA